MIERVLGFSATEADLVRAAERGVAIWHRSACEPSGDRGEEYAERFRSDLRCLAAAGVDCVAVQQFDASGEPGSGPVDRRPKWKALRQALEDDLIGLLVAGQLHELGRDQVELASFFRQLAENNVLFWMNVPSGDAELRLRSPGPLSVQSALAVARSREESR